MVFELKTHRNEYLIDDVEPMQHLVMREEEFLLSIRDTEVKS